MEITAPKQVRIVTKCPHCKQQITILARHKSIKASLDLDEFWKKIDEAFRGLWK